jgi:hypothetical protein
MNCVTLECVIIGLDKKSSAPGSVMLMFVLLIVIGRTSFEQLGTEFQTLAVVIVPDSTSQTVPPKAFSVVIAFASTP